MKLNFIDEAVVVLVHRPEKILRYHDEILTKGGDNLDILCYRHLLINLEDIEGFR